jgi:hypothetical protein
MFRKYTLLKIRFKIARLLKLKPKISQDEEKIIAMVKNLANNNSTTILLLPLDRISAYNDKINLVVNYRKIEIADENEYYEFTLGQDCFDQVYNILKGIVISRIRQTEKRISNKKTMMLEKMISDATVKPVE